MSHVERDIDPGIFRLYVYRTPSGQISGQLYRDGEPVAGIGGCVDRDEVIDWATAETAGAELEILGERPPASVPTSGASNVSSNEVKCSTAGGSGVTEGQVIDIQRAIDAGIFRMGGVQFHCTGTGAGFVALMGGDSGDAPRMRLRIHDLVHLFVTPDSGGRVWVELFPDGYPGRTGKASVEVSCECRGELNAFVLWLQRACGVAVAVERAATHV